MLRYRCSLLEEKIEPALKDNESQSHPTRRLMVSSLAALHACIRIRKNKTYTCNSVFVFKYLKTLKFVGVPLQVSFGKENISPPLL